MTVHAIAGLAAFNLFVGLVGAGVLFGIRPSGPRELLRLGGVAYLLGVAALMAVFTLLLVIGVPLGWPATLLTGVAIGALGVAVGRRRSRTLGADAPARWGLAWIPSAAVLALSVVVVEAVFRKGRLQGLIEFDGWDSWGPKVKEIYFTGHLPPDFLAPLPGGSYPPGVPAILSAGLHWIGSADVATVHLQYWFFAVGFLAALVGLLAGRAAPLVVLPFVLLVFVMPDVRSRSVDMYGDLPLGYLVATGALLLALWLDDRQRWRLEATALLFAAATLTKREGVLLAGCIFLAAALASLDRPRFALPRLGAAFAPALAAWLTWFVWLRAHDLPGNGPAGGLHFLTDLGRGWDSLHVVVSNLFDYDLWLVAGTMAAAAVGLCLLARAWRTALFVAAAITISVLGATVTVWSDPNIQLADVNLISRLVGTVALTAVALTPLALQRAWAAVAPTHEPAGPAPRWALAAAAAMVAVGAIAYPAAVVAGGTPRFPGAHDCGEAEPTGPVVVVLGHEESFPRALRLQARVTGAGFRGSKVARDGCGDVRVYIDDVPSGQAAEALVRRARIQGLDATTERLPG